MAITVKLKKYQVEPSQRMLAILTGGNVCINASDTGTGKTYMALHCAKELGMPVLVIAPAIAEAAWYAVAEGMGIRHLIKQVLTIHKIRNGKTKWWDGMNWTTPPEGMLIIWDEPHDGASGVKSQATRIMAKLRSASNCKVITMSATIADTPLKLRGLGYLLGLHNYSLDSFYTWCRVHGCLNSPWARGALVFTQNKKKQKSAMEAIRKEIGPRLVRVSKQDTPGFPESELHTQLFTLPAKEIREINDLIDDLIEHEVNPMVIRLRARQYLERYKAPIYAQLAIQAVEEGNSVVLFVNFRETMALIKDALHAKGYDKVALIHGLEAGYTKLHRDNSVAMFQDNKVHIAIATVQAGGVSINLHDVKQERPRVSVISPPERASHMVQCMGRIHRMGGTHSIQTVALLSGTVEEKIYKSLQSKQDNISTLQDDDLSWDGNIGGVG